MLKALPYFCVFREAFLPEKKVERSRFGEQVKVPNISKQIGICPQTVIRHYLTIKKTIKPKQTITNKQTKQRNAL